MLIISPSKILEVVNKNQLLFIRSKFEQKMRNISVFSIRIRDEL